MLAEQGFLGRVGRVLRRPRVTDSVLAVAYTVAALVLGQEPEPGDWHALDARGALLTVLIGVALAARRMAPVPVLGATVAVWLVYIALGYWPVVNSPAVLLALYAVAVSTGRAATVVCSVAVGAAWVVAGVIYREHGSMSSVLVQAVAFPLGVALLGRTAGLAAERSVRLAELTRRLRAEQEARAAQAVTEALTEERVRIARELHDVVAHHLSVVSLQAGLASYVFEGDPRTARGALDTIAGTSREALDELRRMLTLLRVGSVGAEDGVVEEDEGPAPGLGRVEELLARVRGAGVAAELLWEGEPFALPPGMDLCVYRVIQEALTNVLKHAGPATATVSVRFRPHHLTVRVTDDGAGLRDSAGLPGLPGVPGVPGGAASAGHGLIGMRERARVYRGTVSAGPRPEGGFEVLLTLPAPRGPEDGEAASRSALHSDSSDAAGGPPL
ncbi:sensor histidine kinase [Kitasatospora albolonga]|uniref:sensor histidine kinase n=1 Tax=Kitasatospora albolonga TaxID=68173 RepID=UPI0031EE39C9